MGWLSGLLTREERAAPVAKPAPTVERWFGRSSAGRPIDAETALQSTAVWGCVRVLAESVAQLPLMVFERQGDGGKVRARNHALWRLLHDLPNPEMTSFGLREMLMSHMLLRGNAYCEIVWDRRGQVQALWPLHADWVEVRRSRESGEREYVVRVPMMAPVVLRAGQVWHLHGPSTNGLTGLSPVTLHARAIGLGLDTEEFGARFFGNGARPSGVLEHPATLSDEAYARLRASWAEGHEGLSNAHRVAILEEGVRYSAISVTPNEAQFLETRQYQVQDIARIFRVPPHMLADLERATFGNIEHQSLEFVKYSLQPWLTRFEQTIARDLMLPTERERYFAAFLVDGLQRGDIATRYQAYAIGRQNGWLSADDIREREDMNRLPDGQGEVYLIPLNMVPAGSVVGASAAGQEPGERASAADGGVNMALPVSAQPQAAQLAIVTIEGRAVLSVERRAAADNRHALQLAYDAMFADALARAYRRERQDVLAQARKSFGQRAFSADFDEWLTAFYDEHRAFIEQQIGPVVGSLAPLVARSAASEIGAEEPPTITNFVQAYLAAAAARHAARNAARVREIVSAAESEATVIADLEQEMQTWDEARAQRYARDESVRSVNALALAALGALGVTRKVWVAFGDSCPYCRGLNGRTIGIDEWFIPAGQEYWPDGADVVLRVGRDVGHAPAHAGCDCMVVSA